MRPMCDVPLGSSKIIPECGDELKEFSLQGLFIPRQMFSETLPKGLVVDMLWTRKRLRTDMQVRGTGKRNRVRVDMHVRPVRMEES